jgi:FAD synthase
MRVLSLADDLSALKSPVVTLGSFDGVHRGHRKLLAAVQDKAEETGGESVVITFSRHPRQVLPHGGEIKVLNTLREKKYLLDEAGIHNVLVLPFDDELSSMTSYDFVKDIMVGRVGMKWLVVGYDHHFGHRQEGNHGQLQRLKEEFGFGLERVAEYRDDGSDVSSSTVRHLIAGGDMRRAAELLGRGYLITGVIKGGILVPESGDKLLPPPGLYGVSVEYDALKGSDVLKMDHEGVMRLETSCRDCKDVYVTFD